MIGPGYVRLMARYNAWQNRQVLDALDGVSLGVLRADHGAFFGSILGTLNHLLWADRIWMSRFDEAVDPPAGGIAQSPDLHPSLGAWSAERFQMDGRIRLWAEDLGAVDLTGDLAWYSGAFGHEVKRPLGLCIAHMFNHQTHHRGQVHAMLTKSGLTAPVSDLFAMPGEDTE